MQIYHPLLPCGSCPVPVLKNRPVSDTLFGHRNPFGIALTEKTIQNAARCLSQSRANAHIRAVVFCSDLVTEVLTLAEYPRGTPIWILDGRDE